MVVEIGCGFYFNSMALLADGVHMGTHVGALGLAAAAYWLARRHAGDARFSFGSGKFGDLAAFASAILLGVTALLVAVIGLAVNLVCALILKDAHGHDHGHDHGGDQGHAHKHDGDNNIRAAYVHVLADAATSVLAIAALAGGYFGGWGFLDPLAALVGAGVIGAWAYGLTRDSAMVLLDADADPQLSQDIRQLLSGEMGARVADLHLWRLGPGHRGLIVSLVAPGPVSAETIKTVLRARHPDLSHVTVEVAICADCT
jgi:cation diffusion facilitator family transporter